MNNLRDFGVIPNDYSAAVVARNTTGIVDCLNAGKGMYVPSGTYYHLPIGKHLPNVTKKTSLYGNMRGDGIKQSILARIYGDPTKGAWDFDGLFFFDMSVEQISFQSNTPSPFIFRLTSGGLHYRVSFRDVCFRSNRGGDGLVIENTQHVILEGVSSYRNAGWGIILKGALGTLATTLDVEYCGAGGLLISNNGIAYRSNCSINIGQLIHEGLGDSPAVRFDGIVNTHIQNIYFRSQLHFTNGAARNVVHGAEESVCSFDGGAYGNYVHGFNNRVSGDDAALNYVGPVGGCACNQIAGPWSGDPVTLTTGHDRYGHRQTLAAGRHVLEVDYQTQGCDWVAYIHHTVGGKLLHYNWRTRKFDLPENRYIGGTALGSGTLRLPFTVTEDDSYGCVIVNLTETPLHVFSVRVSEDN